MSYDWIKKELGEEHGAYTKFARAIGVNQDQVSKIFSGQRKISIAEGVKIAEYLNRSIRWVVDGNDENATFSSRTGLHPGEFSNDQILAQVLYKFFDYLSEKDLKQNMKDPSALVKTIMISYQQALASQSETGQAPQITRANIATTFQLIHGGKNG